MRRSSAHIIITPTPTYAPTFFFQEEFEVCINARSNQFAEAIQEMSRHEAVHIFVVASCCCGHGRRGQQSQVGLVLIVMVVTRNPFNRLFTQSLLIKKALALAPSLEGRQVSGASGSAGRQAGKWCAR